MIDVTLSCSIDFICAGCTSESGVSAAGSARDAGSIKQPGGILY